MATHKLHEVYSLLRVNSLICDLLLCTREHSTTRLETSSLCQLALKEVGVAGFARLVVIGTSRDSIWVKSLPKGLTPGGSEGLAGLMCTGKLCVLERLGA